MKYRSIGLMKLPSIQVWEIIVLLTLSQVWQSLASSGMHNPFSLHPSNDILIVNKRCHMGL